MQVQQQEPGWWVEGWEEGSNAGRPQLHFSTSSFDPQLMMVGYKCYQDQEYDDENMMMLF